MVSDQEKVSDQMLEIGGEHMVAGNYDACLEACKQALSLHPGNMYAAYYASVACTYLGRTGEHEKYCDMLKSSSEPYFHNLGIVMSDSRVTQFSERLNALEAYWASSPKTDLYATIAWGKARSYLPLAMTKSLLLKLIPDLSSNSRIKSFFEAEVAVADNKLETALKKYQESLKVSEGNTLITDEELTVMQFPILRQLRKDDELKALMRAQFSTEHVSQIIWVTVAANLKEMGNRDAAIAIIKKGMKEPNLTEQTVVTAGEIIGASIGEIVDDLDVAQKASPYSWKIRVVALIARGTKEQKSDATEKAFEEAAKYCDDDLEIISLTYTLLNSIFDDATKYKGISADKFAEPKELFRLMFFNLVDHIGTDSFKWFQLGELGLETLQGPSAYRLFKQYLRDFSASSELGSEFFTMLFSLPRR
jgi:tetratricopeptide (TPR) repeat protein